MALFLEGNILNFLCDAIDYMIRDQRNHKEDLYR